MKTIAVIESCDTKAKEAKFISDFIKNEGLEALVLNTATGRRPPKTMIFQERKSLRRTELPGKRWSLRRKAKKLIS